MFTPINRKRPSSSRAWRLAAEGSQLKEIHAGLKDLTRADPSIIKRFTAGLRSWGKKREGKAPL